MIKQLTIKNWFAIVAALVCFWGAISSALSGDWLVAYWQFLTATCFSVLCLAELLIAAQRKLLDHYRALERGQ